VIPRKKRYARYDCCSGPPLADRMLYSTHEHSTDIASFQTLLAANTYVCRSVDSEQRKTCHFCGHKYRNDALSKHCANKYCDKSNFYVCSVERHVAMIVSKLISFSLALILLI